MAAGLNAPAADTARTISDLRAQIKAGRETLSEDAHHAELGQRRRVSERFRVPRGPEAASPVERDRRLIAGGDPEREASGTTLPRPAGHGLDQRDTDAAAALPAVDEHADEHRARALRIFRVLDEPRGQTDPPAVVLCDEGHAIATRRPARRSLVPDALGECFLTRERRAKGRGRVGEGMKSEGPQLRAFVSTNPPDFQAHAWYSSIPRRTKPGWAPTRLV